MNDEDEDDEGEDEDEDDGWWRTPDEPVELPIDGTLDLHTFAPRELGELLFEYLHVCQQRGILELRLIHGKGRGHLRRSVHALLERASQVRSFCLAGQDAGGWGATLVTLHPADAEPPSRR